MRRSPFQSGPLRPVPAVVGAFYRPYFSRPTLIGLADVNRPRRRALHLRAGHPAQLPAGCPGGTEATVQVNIDATQMSQAFIGATYIQNIVVGEVSSFVLRRSADRAAPVPLVVRIKFNPT